MKNQTSSGWISFLVRSPGVWVFAASFALRIADTFQSSLFGVSAEPIAASLAFSPIHPTRLGGLTVFTYPLVHASWNHWLGSAPFWLYLSYSLEDRLRNQFQPLGRAWIFGLTYIVMACSTALGYMVPGMFHFETGDRVLGLSAAGLSAAGVLMFFRPPRFVYLLVIATGIAVAYDVFTSASANSPLTLWGHLCGFLIGLLIGAALHRFYRKPI